MCVTRRRGLEFREAQGPVASFARSLVGSLGHPRGRPVTSPHASTLWARLARRLYNLRGRERGGAGACAQGAEPALPATAPSPRYIHSNSRGRLHTLPGAGARSRPLALPRAGAPSSARDPQPRETRAPRPGSAAPAQPRCPAER